MARRGVPAMAPSHLNNPPPLLAGTPLTASQAMLAGGVAGVPVSLLATPTELLKCRLQAQGGAKPPPGATFTLEQIRAGKALFRGPVQVMRHVVAHEGGVLGLYRGLLPTLVREVPGNAGEGWVAGWIAECVFVP